MGSKERILRREVDTRRNILDKALCIIQSEGCDALTMRKLADQIDYSAPVIYEYFENKDCIYQELARRGYVVLADQIKQSRDNWKDPESQITAMWGAYWDFAFAHQAFYRLMYGINVSCYPDSGKIPEAELLRELIQSVITNLYSYKAVSKEEVRTKFFTYWSVIHGLIAINMIQRSPGKVINQKIIHEAIKGITLSIRE